MAGVLLHLPAFRPVDIEFRDVTYTVSVPRQGKKDVLRGVSGRFQPGQLTAIMGPSGAGKSSLLNILTGLQRSGVGGHLLMNGRERDSCHAEFRRQACFIQQEDPLLPLFTAHELMTSSADLKLGHGVGRKAKALLVDDTLEVLGLAQCRDTRCEQLSGGQRKRLSIALELANNPATMFLDEPTTGLDSSSSQQCISLLKALAQAGRTIICTIHQPNTSLLQMFDHIYVLANGRCVFRGTPAGILPFLESIELPCPRYHSPVDHLLDVASGEYGFHMFAMEKAAQEQCWGESTSKHRQPVSVGGIVQEMIPSDLAKSMMSCTPLPVLLSPPTEWARFPILLNRCLIQLHRDWTVTHLKMFLHMVVGVILGLNFTSTGTDGSKTLSNISYLFCVGIYLSYTAMMPALLRYPTEIALVKKEWFNNWYQLRTYYAAFLVANIPVQMLYCTIFSSITYFLSSQPMDVTRFSMFLGICLLTTLVAESFGLQLGTMFLDNLVNGLFIGSIFLAFLLVFSGFLVFLKDIPVALSWLTYLSYVRYGLEGMVLAVYGNGRSKMFCPPTEIYCHLRNPKTIIRELSMQDTHYWIDIAALFTFLLVIRITIFINLKRKLSSG